MRIKDFLGFKEFMIVARNSEAETNVFFVESRNKADAVIKASKQFDRNEYTFQAYDQIEWRSFAINYLTDKQNEGIEKMEGPEQHIDTLISFVYNLFDDETVSSLYKKLEMLTDRELILLSKNILISSFSASRTLLNISSETEESINTLAFRILLNVSSETEESINIQAFQSSILLNLTDILQETPKILFESTIQDNLKNTDRLYLLSSARDYFVFVKALEDISRGPWMKKYLPFVETLLSSQELIEYTKIIKQKKRHLTETQ